MRATIIPRDDDLRPKAEQLITDAYARYYGARITAFPDTLVARIAADNSIECAAGLRFAADGFFSEAYLDAPIDLLLSAIRYRSVRREKIFEVTSLASRAPHSIGSFLRKIIACGEAAGFEWAFFTATEPLKALIERLALPLLFLAEADRTRVANPDMWGSYYELEPRVYAVHRDDAARCLGEQSRAPVHG
jgi:thermostable hemolysin